MGSRVPQRTLLFALSSYRDGFFTDRIGEDVGSAVLLVRQKFLRVRSKLTVLQNTSAPASAVLLYIQFAAPTAGEVVCHLGLCTLSESFTRF